MCVGGRESFYFPASALLRGVTGHRRLSQVVHSVADIAASTVRLGDAIADAGHLKQFPGMTPATAVNIALLPPLDMLPYMCAAKAAGLG